MSTKVLLVGSGLMAKEYVKVLHGMNIEFDVVGRSETGVRAFKKDTGITAHSGGLESFIQATDSECYSHFIVATNVTSLFGNVKCLLQAGAKNILVEKPCALNQSQMDDLTKIAENKKLLFILHITDVFFFSNKSKRDH